MRRTPRPDPRIRQTMIPSLTSAPESGFQRFDCRVVKAGAAACPRHLPPRAISAGIRAPFDLPPRRHATPVNVPIIHEYRVFLFGRCAEFYYGRTLKAKSYRFALPQGENATAMLSTSGPAELRFNCGGIPRGIPGDTY